MHFGCPTLQGVELENQGGPGTAMDHWEQRILGVSATIELIILQQQEYNIIFLFIQNEAMTGVFTFNPVFSNLTLAALYDSG